MFLAWCVTRICQPADSAWLCAAVMCAQQAAPLVICLCCLVAGSLFTSGSQALRQLDTLDTHVAVRSSTHITSALALQAVRKRFCKQRRRHSSVCLLACVRCAARHFQLYTADA
jgi:hypothetical protein